MATHSPIPRSPSPFAIEYCGILDSRPQSSTAQGSRNTHIAKKKKRLRDELHMGTFSHAVGRSIVLMLPKYVLRENKVETMEKTSSILVHFSAFLTHLSDFLYGIHWRIFFQDQIVIVRISYPRSLPLMSFVDRERMKRVLRRVTGERTEAIKDDPLPYVAKGIWLSVENQGKEAKV
jgi:hypothetical protein